VHIVCLAYVPVVSHAFFVALWLQRTFGIISRLTTTPCGDLFSGLFYDLAGGMQWALMRRTCLWHRLGGMFCGDLLGPFGLGHSLMKHCCLLVFCRGGGGYGVGGCPLLNGVMLSHIIICYCNSPLLISARLCIPVLCYWVLLHCWLIPLLLNNGFPWAFLYSQIKEWFLGVVSGWAFHTRTPLLQLQTRLALNSLFFLLKNLFLSFQTPTSSWWSVLAVNLAESRILEKMTPGHAYEGLSWLS
jgi:hypothetical protein